MLLEDLVDVVDILEANDRTPPRTNWVDSIRMAIENDACEGIYSRQ